MSGEPSASTWAAPLAAPEPPPNLTRRIIRDEIWVVLAVSILASAVSSAIDLFSAPIEGVVRATFDQVGFIKQLASFVFSLAPVALVFHLFRRDGDHVASIGLGRERARDAVGVGAVLGGVVAVLGLGLYLLTVQLGVNRQIVPVPPMGHWWTIPVIAMGAVSAGLLEEVVVVGYLVTRLQQLGWGAWGAILVSAFLRGSYHLYQGWGGFAGNVALGLFFGWWFVRTRRLWPLVIAHALIDLSAGLGYLACVPCRRWL